MKFTKICRLGSIQLGPNTLWSTASAAVFTCSSDKRSFPDSPNAPSPSHLPPLAQRIRADIHVLESELESPEHLRSSPRPVNSPSPISPCLKGLPSPARLIFTPEPASLNCLNCESVMTPNHQCLELISSSVARVKCGSTPPVTAHSMSLSAFSGSELSDDGTPPGSPVVLKRIIRPRKFCDL